MTPGEAAEAHLRRIASAAEPVLRELVATAGTPVALREAMAYSLLGGGKRLRPAICLAAAAAAGAAEPLPRLLPAACALELVHTYSLVHDDLPAMDDAELRRGRAACHRVYGEAMAVLAGDALQALAFEVMARPLAGVTPEAQVAAVCELAIGAGPRGMCGGQALDLLAEQQPPDEAGLWCLQALKTGALITAAAVVGGLLAGARETVLIDLRRYGQALGTAFQIMDDVLDVVGEGEALGKGTGGDARRGKVTVASLHGVPRARELAAAAAARAVAALSAWGGEAETLRALAHFAASRDR